MTTARERVMGIFKAAFGLTVVTADATTEAAGAIGGAAVNGAIGAVRGTASGVRKGLSSGRESTPAAAVTLAAIGAAGLVDWPVVVAIGGTALLVRELGRWSAAKSPNASSAPARSVTAVRRSA
jgi:hypothetical protein